MHRRLVNEAGDASEDTYLLKTVVYAVTPLFPFCFHGGSAHDIPQNRFP